MPSASPFLESHRRAGAVLRPVEGAEYPVRFGHPFEEHRAARSKAAILDLSFLAKLELSGPDAKEFLQRIASADLAPLQPGEGKATYLLNGQGKVARAFDALVLPDGFLLVAESGESEPLARELEKFRFQENVTTRDFTGELGALLVTGPKAEELVRAAAGGAALPGAASLSHAFLAIAGKSVLVVRDRRAGADGFLLLIRNPEGADVLAALAVAGAPLGAVRAGLSAYDSLRIEAGKPRFGLDYSGDLFPQEIALDDAFSLTKGCYPGQETVARIDTYGKVHRRLCGLVLDSPNEDLPERGDKLRLGGDEVGEVRSWAISPSLERPVALAVVRAMKAPTGTELEIAEGERRLTARVCELPIVPA